VLALRPRDISDGPDGMVANVAGTVVQRKGSGTVRQHHPKSEASIRRIPVPEFAAEVLRRRLCVAWLLLSRSGMLESRLRLRRAPELRGEAF